MGLFDLFRKRPGEQAVVFAGGRIEAGDMMLRMLRVALPGVTTVDPEDGRVDGQALALLHAPGKRHALRQKPLPSGMDRLPVGFETRPPRAQSSLRR